MWTRPHSYCYQSMRQQIRLIDNLDSGHVDNVSDIPRLSTNEKAGVGGVAAESGRMSYMPRVHASHIDDVIYVLCFFFSIGNVVYDPVEEKIITVSTASSRPMANHLSLVLKGTHLDLEMLTIYEDALKPLFIQENAGECRVGDMYQSIQNRQSLAGQHRV